MSAVTTRSTPLLAEPKLGSSGVSSSLRSSCSGSSPIKSNKRAFKDVSSPAVSATNGRTKRPKSGLSTSELCIYSDEAVESLPVTTTKSSKSSSSSKSSTGVLGERALGSSRLNTPSPPSSPRKSSSSSGLKPRRVSSSPRGKTLFTKPSSSSSSSSSKRTSRQSLTSSSSTLKPPSTTKRAPLGALTPLYTSPDAHDILRSVAEDLKDFVPPKAREGRKISDADEGWTIYEETEAERDGVVMLHEAGIMSLSGGEGKAEMLGECGGEKENLAPVRREMEEVVEEEEDEEEEESVPEKGEQNDAKK